MNREIARIAWPAARRLNPGQGRLAEGRKTVAVLFCGLVGFTAASDHADPEDVRARIRPYHARLRAEIEVAGMVEKFIGDAVMAVLGAPVAHEDDVESAVGAGLRILEAIVDLNEAGLGLACGWGRDRGGGGAGRAPGRVMAAGPVASAARLAAAPQAGREENFAAWRAVIELFAEDSPTVLVFEDLYWADAALLDHRT